MSTRTAKTDDVHKVPPPSHFAERADAGDETWLEDAIVAYLGLTLGPKQREICRSVVEHERTAVIGANGTGKTYVTGAIALAWQTVRYPAVTFGTSGTGKKLYRTLCRPIENLHANANGGAGLPGTFKKQPPRIDYDDPEHYFEAATPSDAGELEGAHSGYTLAIIEETDKDDVTAETVDAMRSLITDYDMGRMLAVGNPPTDEADIFARITRPESAWNVVRVSSFDSHNVLVETGQRDGEIIDGMATISALREDWQDYHDESWPGVEQAEAWTDPDSSAFRQDLSERWYRRRGGLMAPSSSQVHRPLDPALVERQYRPDEPVDARASRPESLGVDVARSGDDTVAVGARPGQFHVEYAATGTDHTEQEQAIAAKLRDWPTFPVAVDAVGEGSGLADGLSSRFPKVTRYKSNAEAAAGTEYDRCWGESLALFADALADGMTIHDSDLYEQAMVAARTITWSERTLASRGDDGAQVLSASSKDDVKQRLGRSPDHLDAALMAAWVRDATRRTQRSADDIVVL